ncbi:TIGR02678 family protein [Streptoalloteichus hindustanus]|uniref:TIGR02678 family protein n=1 Tax=Streptoalloteichus hindustanus TaxID=2017 RepID=A0A1M5NN92_STRHI|nr:TIGR02678 family protein [Streptoalloteichus hindustanus]SHG90992.1 TIGR02678 family protein [Streptoalloteichus hindustanus]
MSAHPALDVLDKLSDIDAANVVRCARVLLRRPLLRAGGQDGDLLPLVYRHREPLQELFAVALGYRLVVERRFARLYKTGPGDDPTRGEPSLSPRGYAYLALTLAALTGVGRQVLLSRLVADVRAAAGEAGVAVVDDQADRRALTAALRHLLAMGVISETEGTVAPWTGDAPVEALITIDTDVLGLLLAGPLTEASTPEALVELAARPGPRGVEHVVRRRLVENPVVLHSDLTEEQSAWLRRHHRRESVVLERCFGLVTETRVEGVLTADPEEYLTDLAFPGPGTVARIALLALRELRDGDARQDGRHPVRVERVREQCARLVEDYPAAWSRQATEDFDALTGEVLTLLTRVGLATPTEEPGTWLLSPAAHRWEPEPDDTPTRQGAAEPTPAPEPEPANWSLFSI